MALEIDHVIVCLPDLVPSVERFESTHGVTSVEGGRHRGHGTANRLVPLGDTYIELVAVVDETEAAASAFGSWVAGRAVRRGADGLSIRTDDLDEVCSRLDLEPLAMSRRGSEGEELNWRVAGLERLISAGLPFFIQWDVPSHLHPGKLVVGHPRGPARLADIVVSGDLDRLGAWTEGLGGLTIEEGEPGVRFELGGPRL